MARVRTCGLGSRYPSHMKQRSRKHEEEFRSEFPERRVRKRGRVRGSQAGKLIKRISWVDVGSTHPEQK